MVLHKLILVCIMRITTAYATYLMKNSNKQYKRLERLSTPKFEINGDSGDGTRRD
jgi:hypothetical protein